MTHQYTFPHIAIEIMLELKQNAVSAEEIVYDSGRAMLSVLKTLEELMSDSFIYKIPDNTFALTAEGRDFIEDIHQATSMIEFSIERFRSDS